MKLFIIATSHLRYKGCTAAKTHSMNPSLFDSINEKGRAEWGTFNAVRSDKVSPGVFRVKVAERKVPQYGTVIPIRKFTKPHQLFPKAAH